MQPDLQQIIDELRKETCPQRVRDKVRGQIGARADLPHRRLPALRIAVACLVCTLVATAWQWHARETAREARLAQLTIQRAHVAHEAENALGLVGSVLIDAGAHSQKIISDRTGPPLQNSFETTKNKIIQYIDL